MPRTTTLEAAGCPPLRALTFDVLGLIKVTEARSQQGGVAKVVERWGDIDSNRCVLAASMNDRRIDPLLAVARKSGEIELISPVNGDVRASFSNNNQADVQTEEDNVVGLHLFKKQTPESSSRSCTLLTCTMKGLTSLRKVSLKSSGDSACDDTSTWNVCAAGKVLCCKVDESENYALYGGKGVEVNIWDLATQTKIWTAKSPPKNSLGIFTPTWFTSATFLSKDDHRKFVAGTNSHQVRLYDMSAQRRPVMSFDFRETPIKAVTEDLDGNTIYIGNGSGDLASVDIRTGKLLGCFLGKCSGSIRSIARHPDLPVIASCGLDSYLRIWDIESRQLLSAVFLKQHLTNVVFDSHFNDEEVVAPLPPREVKDDDDDEMLDGNKEESPPVKRKKKKKSESHSVDGDEDEPQKKEKKSKSQAVDGDEEEPRKKKKKSKSQAVDGEVEESVSTKRKKAKKSRNVDEDDEELVSVEHEKPKKSKKGMKKSKGERIEVA